MTDQNSAVENVAVDPPGAAAPVAAAVSHWLDKAASALSASLGKKVTAAAGPVSLPDEGVLTALTAPESLAAKAVIRTKGGESPALLIAPQDAARALAAAQLHQESVPTLDDAAVAAFGALVQVLFSSLQAALTAGGLEGAVVETLKPERLTAVGQGFSSGKAALLDVSLVLEGAAPLVVKALLGDSAVELISGAHLYDRVAPAPEDALTNLDRLLKISVPVVVEIASRRITVREVVNFKPGTVVEFDKKSDDLLELTAGNAKIGKGEAVKVGESFGLRMIEVGSLQERIKGLAK